ncbi:hypothetical protein KIW84_076513 [Lathyrus oleraceus]|uniref:Uncharacterized protein n=1 Tax=Pisum sativum TaxID=3888 RepID=A0A9D5A183_PEA|nr:hypothetical protein KIW84_076513 [Pisum sativum]
MIGLRICGNLSEALRSWTLTMVSLWSGLNLLYYDENVLLGLASIVDTLVKENTNTLNAERGRHHTRDCKKTPYNLTQPYIPTVTQPIGLPENNVIHEQRLTKLHQDVDDDSAKIVAKESRE